MRVPPRPSPSFVPVLVILLGLAAACFAWTTTSRAEQLERRRRDEQRGAAAAQRLLDLVTAQTDVLRLLAAWQRPDRDPSDSGLVEALSGLVTDDDRWRVLRSVAFVERVAAGELAGWEASHRLVVHGVDGAAVADDADHHVIVRAWPDVPGRSLPGTDLASDPLRLDALEQAGRSGRLAMSRPVELLRPDSAFSPGVLLAAPVLAAGEPSDRRQGVGPTSETVVGEYALDALLQTALLPLLHADDRPPIRIVVLEDGRLLGSVGPPLVVDEPSLSTTDIDVRGRVWTVRTEAAGVEPLAVRQLLERPSLLLPGAIFIVMVLCAWTIGTLNRRTAMIQSQVAAQTVELRRKNLALEAQERELQEANRRLLEMSNTDPLTGILNRRAFEVQLGKERERARRTGRSWGLLIFDVDSFKDYNDRHGHVAGDEVLRRVAAIIQGEARRIDTVARYGGEEFVVLAAGSDAHGLLALGERIRARIQEAGIPHESAPRGVLTVSAGGSLSSADGGHDSRDVLQTADRCLYEAKSTGRNRVVMRA